MRITILLQLHKAGLEGDEPKLGAAATCQRSKLCCCAVYQPDLVQVLFNHFQCLRSPSNAEHQTLSGTVGALNDRAGQAGGGAPGRMALWKDCGTRQTCRKVGNVKLLRSTTDPSTKGSICVQACVEQSRDARHLKAWRVVGQHCYQCCIFCYREGRRTRQATLPPARAKPTQNNRKPTQNQSQARSEARPRIPTQTQHRKDKLHTGTGTSTHQAALSDLDT
jgi:hypothetical protein